jgi:peptide methionine sulfoxide reductase MsrA
MLLVGRWFADLLCLQSAEDYHQQYPDKNPFGYCGVGGTGVTCPVGVARGGGSVG